ncbi:MAG: hypothetical protein OEV59_02395 [Deltaproteobacteria bacterium]|nr:hypothetical protein [Deltaproteobacteria bacterium]
MLFSILHILHVLAVIAWIGGLAFITIVALPMVIKMPDALQKVLLFSRIEHRFAPLARVYNAVTGITGFAMLYMAGWQSIVFTKEGLGLLIMMVIWFFWAVMLFGLEPLVIRKMLDKMMAGDKKIDIETIFSRMNALHYVLLFVSLVASAAGIVFAHRYSF